MFVLPEFRPVEEFSFATRELVRDIVRFAENEPFYFRSSYQKNPGNTLIINVPDLENIGPEYSGVLRYQVEVASFCYLSTIKNGSYSRIIEEYLNLPMDQTLLAQIDSRIQNLRNESEALGEPTLRYFLEHFLGYYDHYSLLSRFSENSKRKHAA